MTECQAHAGGRGRNRRRAQRSEYPSPLPVPGPLNIPPAPRAACPLLPPYEQTHLHTHPSHPHSRAPLTFTPNPYILIHGPLSPSHRNHHPQAPLTFTPPQSSPTPQSSPMGPSQFNPPNPHPPPSSPTGSSRLHFTPNPHPMLILTHRLLSLSPPPRGPLLLQANSLTISSPTHPWHDLSLSHISSEQEMS